ncbi:hypothetical protein BKA62DRAFT_777688 [Auriculariales sp. MPI-PUGE-AT-0066]|nr:hypothetical protein BKA62DRAFT_777688 [Auriculariales sp. MPI-PUGE-AT-0066]
MVEYLHLFSDRLAPALDVYPSARLVAWTFKFDKVTDLTGGSNFYLLALFTLLAGDRTSDIRSLVVSILVMVWAVRATH